MKRIILLVMTLAVLSGVNACRQNKNTTAPNGKINVTTTNFPPFDFVRQIAGDKVNLAMLLPPGSESHSFEPSPRDIITVQNSDIFIYVGGGSDKWIDRILQSMNPPPRSRTEGSRTEVPLRYTNNMKILAMIDAVETVEEEIVEGMEEDDDNDEETYDEHVWTSPKNAILIVKAITELLCEADPASADFFRQNAAGYTAKLEQLNDAFNEVISNVKRKTIVFADRFPFRYFADAFGLIYFAAFPGCATETEPSAATVKFLIDKIRSEKIPVVFHIELSNERMADTISEETGAKKLLLHSCHNITKRDFDTGLSYLEIMKNNITNLQEALD